MNPINRMLGRIKRRITKMWLIRHYKRQSTVVGKGVSLRNTKLGHNVYIGTNSTIYDSVVGDYSYVSSHSLIAIATIGKFCSIGPNVKAGLGMHPTGFVSTHPAFYSNNKVYETFSDDQYFVEHAPIRIGNDVWVGEGALILDGVEIGSGAIIAARAVVTKDVSPYSIVAGVPAKHIRYRFDEATVAQILNSNWWDRSEVWFKSNFKLFQDPQSFVEFFRNEIPRENE